MRKAKISVLGLWYADNELFKNMVCPAEIDIQNVIDNILLECSELEILYPNPDFMRDYAIPVWSERRYLIWQKLYETTVMKYDPLYNKDAYYEEEEDTAGAQHTKGDSINSTRGFNIPASDEMTDTDKIRSSSDLDHNNKTTRKRREYGNIGVTSSQELVARQRSIVDYSVVEFIVNDFKKEFCLQVY